MYSIMMIRKEYLLIITTVFIILLSIANTFSSTGIIRRLTTVQIAAADFEQQVRDGDILPQEWVDIVCKERNIRTLTIGGSVAFGEGVPLNETYPHLLCEGDKIAALNMKPEDTAYCLQEIIGDKMYDLIILDYFETSDEHLNNLTRRLVNRFPRATIMNTRLYFPGNIGYQHGDGWLDVATWAKLQGNHISMTKEALEMFEASNKPWILDKQNELKEYYDKITKENHIWSLFKDTNDKYNSMAQGEDTKQTLLKRAWLYSDWKVFNKFGHEDIARGILGLALNKTNTSRSDKTNPWDEDGSDCKFNTSAY